MAIKPAIKQLFKFVMDEDGPNAQAVENQYILVANILAKAAVREGTSLAGDKNPCWVL
jgi:hypothetical protein